MSQHIIFLVHGMGVYGKMADGKYKPDVDGWFAEAEKGLKDVYETFIKTDPNYGGGTEFTNAFKIVRIEYDSILEHYRYAWEVQAKEWSKLGLGGDFANAIRTFFEGNSASSFLWTHVADVALYVAPTLRAAVKAKVAADIVGGLRTELAAGNLGSWSVIAHSLGTAVAHDTLRDIRQLIQGDPATAGTFWPPRVICMAANVARVLTDEQATIYSDSLAPLGSHQPAGYISCNHELDPFTRIGPFAPAAGGWVASGNHFRNLSGLTDYYLTAQVVDWIASPTNFAKFAAAVPHGFTHYMRQPKVVACLWPALFGDPPDAAIEPKVRAAYAGDEAAAEKAKLQAQLATALQGVKVPDTLSSAFTQLIKVLGAVK
jgi:hypothetical protein